MNKKKLIYDCDPGIDDAFSISYLKKSDFFDVLLVSSVAGNVVLEYTTRNLRGLVKALDWNVKVSKGAALPIMGEQITAKNFHGETGLGNFEFADFELSEISKKSSYDEMVDILEHSDTKINFIAVGPLTNLALLILGRPDLTEKISEIAIMGGGLKGGNTTLAAEFNILADPEAAEIVFKSGVSIVMAGLDVTEKTNFCEEDFSILKNSDSKISEVLLEILKSKSEISNEKYFSLHDVVPVMYYTHPEIFKYEELFVEVETSGRYTRGMTVADRRQTNRMKPNTKVLLDVDSEKFKKILLETLK